MKPIDKCTTVAELLCDKSRWTTGHYARSANGPCSPLSDDAECFCIIGAMRRVYRTIPGYCAAAARLRAVIGDDSWAATTGWNDRSTFTTIKKAIKKAKI